RPASLIDRSTSLAEAPEARPTTTPSLEVGPIQLDSPSFTGQLDAGSAEEPPAMVSTSISNLPKVGAPQEPPPDPYASLSAPLAKAPFPQPRKDKTATPAAPVSLPPAMPEARPEEQA